MNPSPRATSSATGSAATSTPSGPRAPGAAGAALLRALALLLPLSAAAQPAPSLADCDGEHARLLQPVVMPSTPARAMWLDATRVRWPAAATSPDAPGVLRHRLHHSARGQLLARPGQAVSGADLSLPLDRIDGPLPPQLVQRARWMGAGATLQLRGIEAARLPELLRGQLLITEEDAQGRVRRVAALQSALALDALYAPAAQAPGLGVQRDKRALGAQGAEGGWRFGLWAPTAQQVALCLHRSPGEPAQALLPMQRDVASGVWRATMAPGAARYYTQLVDVFVPDVGIVRNRVTDPWAISLSADSRQAWIGALDEPATQPAGWAAAPRPAPAAAATDAVIYELHVRDFSVGDASVPAAQRGKYAAFTQAGSAGMRHLRRLSAAGLNEVHLLPVFDIASVPERGCGVPADTTPQALAALTPDSPEQQRRAMAAAAGDCFNWGYDPLHFGAPEGSYASDANDGATRVREFRAMVMALHGAGLRVGMDVVYNHLSASGQHAQSQLDRIVPGYFHRLDAEGAVTNSTCCANSATEHRMMERLMVDSAVRWVLEYRIDAFRFDLMGHQPRDAMRRLQAAVERAAGRRIGLIGEGWNFGEVADGARFVQAAQGRLAGTGIGTFSDRTRDALRGGGCCDAPEAVLQRQGWVNGLHLARNPAALAAGLGSRDELQRAADLLRVGLAGTLADYRLQTHDGPVKPLSAIDYAGQAAGYATQPDEVVNYVENHDNPTLWDLNLLKLPPDTTPQERARVQVLALATTAFSQGIAYFHAGVELLRSKNGDRNSYDSGDWFNRIDWTAQDSGFGGGLPPEKENAGLWPALRPLLADAARVKPTPADIAFTRDALIDLLRIRAGSSLLRMTSAEQIQRRLRFHATGPAHDGSLVLAEIDGQGLPGAGFRKLVYVLHAGLAPARIALPTLRGQALRLHPVQRAPGAADARPRESSSWDAASATLSVPPRTALVYVLE